MSSPGGPAMPPGNGGHGSVVVAGPADADVLGGVIAAAFTDLAASRWLIGDPAARRQIFPSYFRLHVERAMASGLVCTTADRAAAALWLPAGTDPAEPAGGYAGRLAAVAGPWISRFLVFDAALGRSHPAGVLHHYLAILAVRPDRQGRGTGTALLRARHAALDQGEGLPVYLEASGLRTRRLYLTHGYADHGSPICLPGGPLMYPMWRQPRPGQDTASSAADTLTGRRTR